MDNLPSLWHNLSKKEGASEACLNFLYSGSVYGTTAMLDKMRGKTTPELLQLYRTFYGNSDWAEEISAVQQILPERNVDIPNVAEEREIKSADKKRSRKYTLITVAVFVAVVALNTYKQVNKIKSDMQQEQIAGQVQNAANNLLLKVNSGALDTDPQWQRFTHLFTKATETLPLDEYERYLLLSTRPNSELSKEELQEKTRLWNQSLLGLTDEERTEINTILHEALAKEMQ